MFTIYELKPRFQVILRPLAGSLFGLGVTANSITSLTMIISVVLGVMLLQANTPGLFLLLPFWMLLRMALNALDGLLAREFGQESAFGAYLNELSDVVSDAALYLPFVAVSPFGCGSVAAVIFLSALSEMAGVLAHRVGSPRRYDGPMGKSDRAFLFGGLGFWLGLAGTLPGWTWWILIAMALAIILNIINRVRGGLEQHA
ncbi:CDP-alcohol phosphatidyltransferase domain-containing protein YnbA [Gammaproteobacteria bacterium]